MRWKRADIGEEGEKGRQRKEREKFLYRWTKEKEIKGKNVVLGRRINGVDFFSL